jgi:membrane-associated phospholipid phosphatase
MRSAVMSGEPGFALMLRRHALLAVMVAAYAILAFWLSRTYAVSATGEKVGALIKHFLIYVPQMVFFILFWRLLHLTYVARVPDRFGTLKAEVVDFLSQRDRLAGGALAVLIMTLMLISFAQLKNLIPTLQPFGWDVAFMELDRAVHFGWLPHKPLLAVFGGYYAMSFFTGIYNVWLLLMYFALLVACFMRPENPVRMQYLVAFLLTWALGGNLIATLFSSAGPVYFGLLGLGDTYDGLVQHLQDHAATGALTVVETQKLLWDFYSFDERINAISAFPSMHVASSTLVAIFAYRLSRLAGHAVAVFAFGMMIGSVLLGWHYAVDGYVGAVIAVLCWKVAGVLVQQFGGFPAATR